MNFSNQSSSGTRGSLSGSTWLPLQPRFPDSSPFTSWHRHPLHHGHLLCWNSGSRLPAPRSPVQRRRPGGAATSVMTPRPTPPPAPSRARRRLRTRGWPEVWGNPVPRRRLRHPGMDVPLRALWLSSEGRSSSWAGFAPVVAVGAWERTSTPS